MNFESHMISVIEFLGNDVMLPFICRQCGACCQESVQLCGVEDEEKQRISQYLGIPLEKWEQPYAEAYSSNRACIFFGDDDICKIHPVKFDLCKSYMGECFDKCIGRSEFQQIVEIFLNNAKDGSASCDPLNKFMFIEKRPPRKVPMKEWPNLWKIFLSANPSTKMIQGFIELNCIPERIWENCKPTNKGKIANKSG